MGGFGGDLPCESVVGPELSQGGPGRNESVRIAPESPVVLGRTPDIMLRPDQQQRDGQAEAGQRLGQRDKIRNDAGIFKTEERPRTPTAGLDIVHDQESAVLLRKTRYPPQPRRRCRVQAAFYLVSSRIAAGASRPLDGSESIRSRMSAVSRSSPR